MGTQYTYYQIYGGSVQELFDELRELEEVEIES